MFTLWQVALIIVVVAGAVEFVSRSAYKRGKEAGVVFGKNQVLTENIYRTERDIIETRDLYADPKKCLYQRLQ